MNRFNPYLMILVAIITVALAWSAAADNVEDMMERAMEDYRAGRVDQSFSLLKQALVLNPSHEGVLHRLCLLNVHHERFNEAEPFCRTLVEKYPGKDIYRFNLFWSRAQDNFDLAQGCTARGDFNCAVRAASEMVRNDPDVPQAHYLLGNLYVMRDGGREDNIRTVAHLREAIRLHEAVGPNSELALSAQDLAMVFTGLGIAYGREDDHDLSIESFEKALLFDPNIVDGQRNLNIARKRRADGRQDGVIWLSIADILGIE